MRNMVQYEIARCVYESTSGLTIKQLSRKTGLSQDAVKAQLQSLIKRGYVNQDNTSEKYTQPSDMDITDLETIRPRTIDELSENDSI